MISRRAILSRSHDDLADDKPAKFPSHPDDQWFSQERLYKDHLAEILSKWENIDDEIWAKVIVLERNRRTAKAYARAPVLTVNGSDDGFDGFRIGVNGFDNPVRDSKTANFKDQIGKGCKIKMDDSGNILVKRLSRSNIYVNSTKEENAVSSEVIKLSNGLLELEKPFKLFDMKKFQLNVNRELKRKNPERVKLEIQCISTLSFVKHEKEVLDCPIWIMLINVVALEMLKAKMPEKTGPPMNPIKIRLPVGSSSDEDPYSNDASSRSSGNRPGGRTMSQDQDYYGPQHWAGKAEVSDLSDEYLEQAGNVRERYKSRGRSRTTKKGANRLEEDPYFNGQSAHVTPFRGQEQGMERASHKATSRVKSPVRGVSQLPGSGTSSPWWHSRMYKNMGYGEVSHYPSNGAPHRSRVTSLSPNRPSRPKK